jgi:hypothetical protein
MKCATGCYNIILRTTDIYPLHRVQNGSVAHPVVIPMGMEVLPPG